MRDIKHITIAIGRHADAADIAISHGIHFLAFHALCLDVESSMEMVGAKLTKSSRELNRDINWLTVFGIGLRHRYDRERKRQYN